MGIPLSLCSPRSSNSIPEPATRSFTVEETSTSPGPAFCGYARADVDGDAAPLCPLSARTSPVCSPARTSRPRVAHGIAGTARAQRMARARAGRSWRRSRLPRYRSLCPRNRAQLACARGRGVRRGATHATPTSPSSAAFAVAPTMSVKTTVARTRSGCGALPSPPRGTTPTSRSTASVSPIQAKCRHPPFFPQTSARGNALRQVKRACATYVEKVVSAMQDESRDPDGRKDVTYVDLHVHPPRAQRRWPGSHRHGGRTATSA